MLCIVKRTWANVTTKYWDVVEIKSMPTRANPYMKVEVIDGGLTKKKAKALLEKVKAERPLEHMADLISEANEKK